MNSYNKGDILFLSRKNENHENYDVHTILVTGVEKTSHGKLLKGNLLDPKTHELLEPQEEHLFYLEDDWFVRVLQYKDRIPTAVAFTWLGENDEKTLHFAHVLRNNYYQTDYGVINRNELKELLRGATKIRTLSY